MDLQRNYGFSKSSVRSPIGNATGMSLSNYAPSKLGFPSALGSHPMASTSNKDLLKKSEAQTPAYVELVSDDGGIPEIPEDNTLTPSLHGEPFLAMSGDNEKPKDHEELPQWKVPPTLNTSSRENIKVRRYRVQTAKVNHRRVISLYSGPGNHSRLTGWQGLSANAEEPRKLQELVGEGFNKLSSHHIIKKPPATAHSQVRPMRLLGGESMLSG